MRKKPTHIAQCLAELAQDAEHMSPQSQEAFAALLPLLAKLYRDDARAMAVLIVSDEDKQTLIRINADEFEANGLLHGALPFHEELVRMNHGSIN